MPLNLLLQATASILPIQPLLSMEYGYRDIGIGQAHATCGQADFGSKTAPIMFFSDLDGSNEEEDMSLCPLGGVTEKQARPYVYFIPRNEKS